MNDDPRDRISNRGQEIVSELGRELYDELTLLVDESALRGRRQHVQDSLAYGAFAEFIAEDEVRAILSKLSSDWRFSQQTRNLLSDAKHSVGSASWEHPAYLEYDTLRQEEHQYDDIDHEYHPRYYISATQPEAEALLEKLYVVGSVNVAEEDMPFRDYMLNTDNLWKYVRHGDITSALDRKSFLSLEELDLTQDGTSVVIASPDGTLEFPVALITSATGFASWRGRPENVTKSYTSKFGAKTAGSLEAIKHYASLDTEIPPINKVYVYVQPDGTVFATNGEGDSHRIAAAYLRGEKMINAREIEIVRTTSNLV